MQACTIDSIEGEKDSFKVDRKMVNMVCVKLLRPQYFRK